MVYGLLGVANDSVADIMRDKIGSKKSSDQVFKETARAILQPEGQDADYPVLAQLFLAHAGAGYAGRSAALPSWVPDWTNLGQRGRATLNLSKPPSHAEFWETIDQLARQQGESLHRADYAAGGKDVAFEAKVDDKSWTLALRAASVDSLAHLGPAMLFGTGLQLHQWVLSSVAGLQKIELSAFEADALPDATWRALAADSVWHTLLADRVDEQHPAPAAYAASFEAWVCIAIKKQAPGTVARILGIPVAPRGDGDDDSSSSSSSSQDTDFIATDVRWQVTHIFLETHNRISATCQGRRLGVTSKGRLALVPAGSEKGDIVCVVSGVQTPFVLRQAERGPEKREVHKNKNGVDADDPGSPGGGSEKALDGEYVLIGDCYVHGIMDGEAMPAELEELILV